MRCGNTIYKSADLGAAALNTIFVPGMGFISFLCNGVQIQGIQPAAAAFFINTTTPGTRSRIYFHLVTEDPAILIISFALAAELDAGVKILVQLVFHFKNKITIILFCGQEGIWFCD